MPRGARCIFSVDLSWLSTEISTVANITNTATLQALNKSLNDSLTRYTHKQVVISDAESQIFGFSVASRQILISIQSKGKSAPKLIENFIKDAFADEFDPESLVLLGSKKLDLNAKTYPSEYPPESAMNLVSAQKDLENELQGLVELQSKLNAKLDKPELSEVLVSSLEALKQAFADQLQNVAQSAALAKSQHNKNVILHQAAHFKMQETQKKLEEHRNGLKERIVKINTKHAKLSDDISNILRHSHLLGMSDDNLEQVDVHMATQSKKVELVRQNIEQVVLI